MKKRLAVIKFILIILSIFIIIIGQAYAAGQGKNPKYPKPIGAVNSSNGGVYKKGTHGIIIKYMTHRQDQLYRGNDKIDFVRPGKGKKSGKKAYEKNFHKTQITLRAGIWNNFDARLVVPFLNKELTRQSFNAEFTDNTAGLGDVILFGRYQLLSPKKKDSFNLAIGLGLEMPTGKTSETDSKGKIPGYIQTGGGAWNPIFEIGAHKIINQQWLGSHFLYKMTTKGELGSKDFERPDVFKYNFSYGYALSKHIDLQLELNGEVKSKAKLEGIKQNNSGGHMIFMSPGVHFKLRKGMHFDLCAPIPVYRNLNGIQLSEDYRIVARFAIKF